MSKNQKALLIIFGGTGDLAYRKLYPALYKLYQKNYLNENFAVVGTARRPWTNEYYREVVLNSIGATEHIDKMAQKFASHFYYLSHNINDSKNYQELLALSNQLDKKYQLDGNRLFYLSVSPALFGTIGSHLRAENLISDEGYNRLIIEKPFGTNLEDSTTLNEEILEAFDEEQIYRIDHYLGKEMIQAIPALRFGNPLLKKIWSKDFISNIQITLAEDIGVEDRGAYYEHSGALRDMGQNHILQIVSLLLMNEPDCFDSDCVCAEKIKALKELVPITDETIKNSVVRGQYVGSSDYPELAAYRSEREVDPHSNVETFVAVKVESSNENWQGVPLYFRTGKRMKAKNTQIDIVFRKDIPLLFDDVELANNILTIQVGPEEGIAFKMNSKKVGMDVETERIQLNYTETRNIPEDYERLILNALQADKKSFVHAIEVAESWKYIDAIRAAWKKDASTLKFYPVMNNGPKEAFELLEKNGHQWIWN